MPEDLFDDELLGILEDETVEDKADGDEADEN